mmetsp:Transcript_16169/g.25220  ORF Transcript_16169/g.25220 Transcript_16169/m.25220 type:complete len:441 (-) Transcript_16169:1295-2617(-)
MLRVNKETRRSRVVMLSGPLSLVSNPFACIRYPMTKRGVSVSTDNECRVVKAKSDDDAKATITPATGDAKEENNTSISNQVFSREGIVANILSHLEISDIARCSEVSKTCLNALSLLEELYIHPAIADSDKLYCPDGLCYFEVRPQMHFAVKRLCPENSLRKLHINFNRMTSSLAVGIDDVVDKFSSRLFTSCQKKLKHFHVKGLRQDLIADLSTLDKFAELETLIIEDSRVYWSLDLTSFIQNKPNLQELMLSDIYYCGGVSDSIEFQSPQDFSSALSKLTSLKKLSIGGKAFGELNADIIFKGLINLEELTLGDCFVNDDMLGTISEHCLKLQVLRIDGCNIHNHYTISGLEKVVRTCPLQVLSIPRFQGWGSCLANVTEICGNSNTLMELEISTKLVDHDCKPFMHSLSEIKRRQLLESAVCISTDSRTNLKYASGE